MTERRGDDRASQQAQVEVMDWADVNQPGCYLHLATGLLARVRAPRESAPGRRSDDAAGQVARLSNNPEAPLAALRDIATRSHYRVNF